MTARPLLLALLSLSIGCGGAGGPSPTGPLDAEPDDPRDAGPGDSLDRGPDGPRDAALDGEPADAHLDRIWFVADGALDGDGSRDRPFGAPVDAYAVARAGDTVLLLPGEHPAPPAPPSDVVLSGAGLDATTVVGPWSLDAPALVRELAVTGGLTLTAAVALDSIEIEGVLHVDGAVTARDLYTRGEVTLTADARFDLLGGTLHSATGDALTSAGEIRLDAVTASAPEGSAIVVTAGSTTLVNGWVERAVIGVEVTGGQADVEATTFTAITDRDALGAAVRVRAGEAHLTGVTIEDVARALRVDADGRLFADGVVARDIDTDGLSIQSGAAEVDGLRIEGPGNAGIALTLDARLTLTEATVVAPGRVGVLVDGATLDARGLLVDGSTERGITLARATATLDGFRVQGAGNVGVQITDPAGPVRLVNGAVSSCRTSGVGVFGDGEITFEGVVVEGTVRGEGDLGEGVHVYRGTARMAGIIARDNAGAGVLYEESTGTLTDVQLSGNGDPGLVALDPPDLISAVRLTARDNGGAGVVVLGGRLALADSVAEANRAAFALGPGHGFYAGFGGALDVEGGAALSNAASGVAYELGTTGRVEGIQMLDNGAFGLSVGCGAMVSDGGGLVFMGNAAGERGGCP